MSFTRTLIILIFVEIYEGRNNDKSILIIIALISLDVVTMLRLNKMAESKVRPYTRAEWFNEKNDYTSPTPR